MKELKRDFSFFKRVSTGWYSFFSMHKEDEAMNKGIWIECQAFLIKTKL